MHAKKPVKEIVALFEAETSGKSPREVEDKVHALLASPPIEEIELSYFRLQQKHFDQLATISTLKKVHLVGPFDGVIPDAVAKLVVRLN